MEGPKIQTEMGDSMYSIYGRYVIRHVSCLYSTVQGTLSTPESPDIFLQSAAFKSNLLFRFRASNELRTIFTIVYNSL